MKALEAKKEPPTSLIQIYGDFLLAFLMGGCGSCVLGGLGKRPCEVDFVPPSRHRWRKDFIGITNLLFLKTTGCNPFEPTGSYKTGA